MYITFLRHAKSSWSSTDLNDHDRPLNKRGESDTFLMAQKLKRFSFSRAFVSTALRAQMTYELIDHTLQFHDLTKENKSNLYLASAFQIIDVLKNENLSSKDDILIVGHNPGLTELANLAVNDLTLDNLPTCAFFRVEIEKIEQLEKKKAKLIEIVWPKKFK